MKKHLYILWTNADKVTSENMVMMYARNSMLKGWWDRVTVIVWGATQLLICNDDDIQSAVLDAQEAGVFFSACIACANKLGTAKKLMEMGIEVISWGEKLTNLIQSDEKVLSI